jgi:hypothetical protein
MGAEFLRLLVRSHFSVTTNVAPDIDPSMVGVTIVPADRTSPLPVLVNREPEKVDEDRAKEIMTQEDFELVADLGGLGEPEAKYWTRDFSFVRIRFWFLSADAHTFFQGYVALPLIIPSLPPDAFPKAIGVPNFLIFS